MTAHSPGYPSCTLILRGRLCRTHFRVVPSPPQRPNRLGRPGLQNTDNAVEFVTSPAHPTTWSSHRITKPQVLVSKSHDVRFLSHFQAMAAVGSGSNCPRHLGFSRSSTTLVPETPREDVLSLSPGPSRCHIIVAMTYRELHRHRCATSGEPHRGCRRHSVPVRANPSRFQAARRPTDNDRWLHSGENDPHRDVEWSDCRRGTHQDAMAFR
jgi:hypothetical protein